MKLKRIISTALTVVLLFTTITAVLPINASAAHSPSSSVSNSIMPEGVTEANLTMDQLLAYLGATDDTKNDPNSYLNYNFKSAAEMLAHELSQGYLYCASSTGNYYTMYVNKYTGFVYYVNNITGQILTSNPVNVGYTEENGTMIVQSENRADLMSQISISFFETANPTNSSTYVSHAEAAIRGQISVSAISGGFRVSYVLGDTTARYLLPGVISAESFESNILIPMINYYESLLNEYCGDLVPDKNLNFFDNEEYNALDDYGYVNLLSGSRYKGARYYLANTLKLYESLLKYNSPEYKALDKIYGSLVYFLGAYTLYNPQYYEDMGDKYSSQLETIYKNYPVTKDGVAVYVYSQATIDATKESYADIIKALCPDYTFSMMYADEAECGYVDDSAQKPVFRCAIEYTFNSDGSLSASLPASSITFDESVYTLNSITPLMYFGCGDMLYDGYMFYPDGSGTVIEFADFYDESIGLSTAMNLSSSIFGSDFSYSNITGAHRQQITMPVYGIVNEVAASDYTNLLTGEKTVHNGFFAIIEEGSSMASLGFTSGGASHRYATAFALYNPYPSDVYDLSETISVGSLGTYTIVSDSKYMGNYTTRYAMLTDNEVGEKIYGEGAYYESTYNGMAAYYRNYLKDAGVLKSLELVSSDLPLYIEVLGSMEIIKKILTFPVTVSIPLTTFSNVAEMYNQLSNCSTYVQEAIEKYTELVANEKDDVIKAQYQLKLDSYTELSGQIEESIDNINFRLTGFANGGTYATYPAKVKWDKAVGGKSGFKNLLKTAQEESEKSGINFGVYPEFDFMYVNHTSAFDGITIKKTISRMIDNRYASKQEYNEVLQMFESCFSLVVKPEALDGLYSKFYKKYSKYNISTLSASTLGNSLNSNFDEDAPVNREAAKIHVIAMLDRMANETGYELMIDTGNVYAVEYVTHILNSATDSSHFRFSSYAIPFTGLVLHSYVNYTGTPINYSGLIEYEILRSIENGAAPYFLVCFQNTAYMKEDMKLNKYYGVDYANWYDKIVSVYTELNAAIGGLQDFELVGHQVLFAERVIEDAEYVQMLQVLANELLASLDKQIGAEIDKTLDELRAEEAYDTMLKFVLSDSDRAALVTTFCESLNVDYQYLEDVGFISEFDKLIEYYENEYKGSENGNNRQISFSSFVYETEYSYVTDSCAQDKDYVYTDFTCDNGNVVLVTYKKGDEVKRFVLNYNNFTVNVKRSDGTILELGQYSYDDFDRVITEEAE